MAAGPAGPYRDRMLTPPEGLPLHALAEALGRCWGLTVASAEYRPVGWGSQHWEVTGTGLVGRIAAGR